MTEETVREKLEEPYRMRCPEGHAHVSKRTLAKTTPTIHCEECGMSYRLAELVDMRERASSDPVFE